MKAKNTTAGQADRSAGWARKVVLDADRRALVAEHLGLVGVHLRRFVPTPLLPTRHREYEDLFQEGCVALARAAARYDPARDGSFASYALPRIRGAIHAALYEYFATVRVPVRKVRKAARVTRAKGGADSYSVQELTARMCARLEAPRTCGAHEETVRHVLWQRFERAVRLALEDLRKRRWRRRDPVAIIERIAAERLLISEETDRTPLRRIAREAGVSSSRVCEYEALLMRTVRRYLARDVQARLLVRWAANDTQGFHAPIDDQQRWMLRRADMRRFMKRFQRLDRQRRAEVVYSLMERSTSALEEVVCNLYRLCGEDEGFLCVA